jgi:signal transduction histidine kinase
MIIIWLACGLLTAGFIAVLVKLVFLKKDIRQLSNKLNEITKTDTNAHLRTNTFDKDIVALSESMNGLLEKQRQIYLETNNTQNVLKRAITNISHDLRTPLTSAKGYLQMAENDNLDKETQLRYLSIIRGRLDALTVLMDSLFAFSRAVEGDITLQRVNICNLLRDTLADNFAEIEGGGFAVEATISDAPVYCMCDDGALKRVLQNLISNAILHGKDYLRVQLLDNVIEIANKVDNIEQIDAQSIFDRFYTTDASRSNKRTGLGLAIAKELAGKMGGSISADKADNMLIISLRLPLQLG